MMDRTDVGPPSEVEQLRSELLQAESTLRELEGNIRSIRSRLDTLDGNATVTESFDDPLERVRKILIRKMTKPAQTSRSKNRLEPLQYTPEQYAQLERMGQQSLMDITRMSRKNLVMLGALLQDPSHVVEFKSLSESTGYAVSTIKSTTLELDHMLLHSPYTLRSTDDSVQLVCDDAVAEMPEDVTKRIDTLVMQIRESYDYSPVLSLGQAPVGAHAWPLLQKIAQLVDREIVSVDAEEIRAIPAYHETGAYHGPSMYEFARWHESLRFDDRQGKLVRQEA